MHVVIMAAGRGRRLGELTQDYPKALIEVAGEPLIGHSLRFARQAAFEQRIVVGGFCFDQLATSVRSLDAEATIVENTELHAGNLLSLVAGLGVLPADEAFLLMNTDHIYPEGVARVVAKTAASASEITAFCDFDRDLGADDMKVRFEGDHVRAMSKQLTDYDAGYVGMTWIPKLRRAAYDSAVKGLRSSKGDDNAVEQVLVHLADGGELPAIADISGHGWYEIDEPSERDAAEKALAAR